MVDANLQKFVDNIVILPCSFGVFVGKVKNGFLFICQPFKCHIDVSYFQIIVKRVQKKAQENGVAVDDVVNRHQIALSIQNFVEERVTFDVILNVDHRVFKVLLNLFFSLIHRALHKRIGWEKHLRPVKRRVEFFILHFTYHLHKRFHLVGGFHAVFKHIH